MRDDARTRVNRPQQRILPSRLTLQRREHRICKGEDRFHLRLRRRVADGQAQRRDARRVLRRAHDCRVQRRLRPASLTHASADPSTSHGIETSDCRVPSSGSRVPTSESHAPTSGSLVPMSGSCVPTSESRAPMSESHVPMSESHVPMSGSRSPMSGSHVPRRKSHKNLSATGICKQFSQIDKNHKTKPRR